MGALLFWYNIALVSRFIGCYRFAMTRISDNARGALVMSLSMVAFTSNDTCMKLLSGDLPLFQAIFLRGIGTTILLAVLTIVVGQMRWNFSRRDWGLVVIRSLCELAAAWTFLTAIFNMQLANATAILQAMPLVMTLLGATLLKEQIGWRRIAATAIGFIGVLMIVQPGGEDFNQYSLYALATIAIISARDIAARKMSAEVPSLFAALIAAFAVTVGTGIASIFIDWAPVTVQSAGFLAGAMIFVLTGYTLSVICMRMGDVSFISPFRYVGLLAGIVLGYVVFDQIPSTLALLGCLIVVLSGLFIFKRERVVNEGETE